MPKHVTVLSFSGEKQSEYQTQIFVVKSQSVQLNIICQKHKTQCLMCWGGKVFLNHGCGYSQHSKPRCPSQYYKVCFASCFSTCLTTLHGLLLFHKSCNSLALQEFPLSITEAKAIPRWRKATSKVITERLYVPCFTTHWSSTGIPSATFNT